LLLLHGVQLSHSGLKVIRGTPPQCGRGAPRSGDAVARLQVLGGKNGGALRSGSNHLERIVLAYRL
jgi:hypothetical protein